MQNIQTFFQGITSANYQLYIDYFVSHITLESFLKFLVLYFFIVWISIIVWVYKDITNRTESIFYQIISLFIVFIFTPLGIFIYILIRPGRTMTEKYYEEIEGNLDILSDAIAHTVIACPSCKKEINSHYSYCPHCDFALYSGCKGCGKPVFFDWNSCPHCGKKHKKKDHEEKSEKHEVSKKDIDERHIEKREISKKGEEEKKNEKDE